MTPIVEPIPASDEDKPAHHLAAGSRQLQAPHALSLGASVPSASAVAEASDHRPSVLGATG
jgi:hypothetical protein